MNAWKPILIALALMAALPASSEGSSSACKKPLKGTWSFGQAPKACDPNTNTGPFRSKYSRLTFDEREKAATERSRYTQDMHAFLREASDFYLEQRRSSPTANERREWRRAVMALAHQESYWSHFRLAPNDGALKFMRGDNGYGHGILQIDERWHPKIALSAKGEDLTTNIMYGLDIFFQAWERAAKSKCVKNNSFEQRARTAYSAYNGGAGSACRWTKKSKWSRNDRGYFDKFKKQEWSKFAGSPNHRSPVDVACLVEGNESCGGGPGVAIAVEAHQAIYWILASAAIEDPAIALRSGRTSRSRFLGLV